MDFTPLTAHLQSLHMSQQNLAIRHPFLVKAGEGSLEPAGLCKWLVQDKYYQFGYVNFIGRLISKLDLTPYAFPSKDGPENLQWKTLGTLATALEGIKSEIDFYNKTVDKYDLQLERDEPSEVTKQYIQLFEESSAVDKPMIWGLVVLWATEWAWSVAKSSLEEVGATKEDKGAVAALHHEFIPNWSSQEFRNAVKSLADMVNEWVGQDGKDQRAHCEQIWLHVLELETQFWPSV